MEKYQSRAKELRDNIGSGKSIHMGRRETVRALRECNTIGNASPSGFKLLRRDAASMRDSSKAGKSTAEYRKFEKKMKTYTLNGCD